MYRLITTVLSGGDFMDIFGILSFIGGISLFLYGMTVMGTGLEKTAGGKLESFLEKLSSSVIRGVISGAVVTAVIQSSTATTVMVIGFVNSGIMKLGNAVGVIMGANLGTTVTSWLLSLTGIGGDNVFVNLLKPSSFAPVTALVGLIMLKTVRRDRIRNIGEILLGFSVLMTGMTLMSEAVEPLSEVPEFVNLLGAFDNPLLGILAGAVITSIIQSSSASVGILQALSVTGALTVGSAVPIVMGQNIGTCVTALISSIGAGKNAKRAAFVHLYFNLVGSAIIMTAFFGVNAVVDLGFAGEKITPAGIAVVHTVFNLLSTLILLPFAKALEALARFTVPDRDDASATVPEDALLDERFLIKPSFALKLAGTALGRMTANAFQRLSKAVGQFGQFSENTAGEIATDEDRIDLYEEKLRTYLLKINGSSLSERESIELTRMLYIIEGLKNISDHAAELSMGARALAEDRAAVSDEASHELRVLLGAVTEIASLTDSALRSRQSDAAQKVEPLHFAVSELCSRIRERHIERLRAGICKPESSPAFTRVIDSSMRIADRCSDIAIFVMGSTAADYDTHSYAMRLSSDPDFRKRVEEIEEKYRI